MTKAEKYISMFVAVAVFVIALVAFFRGDKDKDVAIRDFNEIKERGKLIVVMEYSSTSYQRIDSTFTGRQYELVKNFAEYINVEPEIKLENSFSKSISGLKSGEYDIMARLTPITTDLQNEIAFSAPISKDRQVLVQRHEKDTTSAFVKDVLQLQDKKIFIAEDSPFMLRLRNLEEEVGFNLNIETIPDYNNEQIAMLVSSGDIDYSVCDFATAFILKEKYKNLDISVNISFTQLQAWAVNPKSVILLDTLNSWISTLPKDLPKAKKR